jgi:hypothetical protein
VLLLSEADLCASRKLPDGKPETVTGYCVFWVAECKAVSGESEDACGEEGVCDVGVEVPCELEDSVCLQAGVENRILGAVPPLAAAG